LRSLGKIDASDKDTLNSKVSALRETIKSGNNENIKKEMEELQKSMYEVSTKLYQKAAPQGDSSNSTENNSQEASNSENVYNADYKEVDPENK